MIRGLVLFSIAASLVAFAISYLLVPGPAYLSLPFLLLVIDLLIALALVQRGRVDAAVASCTGLTATLLFAYMWLYGAVSAPAWFALVPLVLFVGLSVSGPAALAASALFSLGGGVIVMLAELGLLPAPYSPHPARVWLFGAHTLLLTAGILHVALGILRASRTEVAAKERARAELEERLIQSRRLEAIGRLAAGVAHEFNNVLTVVLAEATRLARIGSPRAVASADNVREAAERAAALTRQLLAFGQRQMLELERLDLDAVLRQLAPLLRKVTGEDIALETELAAGPRRVRADRTALVQVLLNLVTNARDAMPGGGTITLRTGAGTLRGEPAVALEVRDTGVGMDEGVRGHLFEPFFTTKGAAGKGSGLGLATVHALVTQLGGDVEVATAPGAGTTFRLLLPIATGEQVATPATEAAPSAPGRGASVWIVDDDPLVRRAIETIVAEGGYAVASVSSGAELLAVADTWTQPPDLVLTDVVMPDMTGPELVGQLRARFPGLHVLYMSGYAEDRVSERGVLLDGVHFVAKPFEPTGLLDKIGAVLASPNPGAAGRVEAAGAP